jgi:hypothetical protein
MPLARRHGLSRELRRDLPLGRGERVIAHADLAGGGVAVATDRALLLPAEGRCSVLPWHRVARAEWDDETHALTVTDLGGDGHRPDRIVLELAEPNLLPETVRERVTASIVVSRHVRLTGGSGVRVIGRRVSGADQLAWQMVWDAGVDPTVAEYADRADAALAQLREQTGA